MKKIVKTKQNANARAKFPVVGIGCSAGGLAAAEPFFKALPTKTGVAFILIQHLDPDHESLLVELLQRDTDVPVIAAEDGMAVEPDHIYVIPPAVFLTIDSGKLQLTPAVVARGARLPVDVFFRSLAEERREKAIAVILSGAGQDGSLGIAAIKEAGGMVMAQNPEDANHDGMPRSAIASSMVDMVLAAADMPEAISKYVAHPYVARKETLIASPPLGARARGSLDEILDLLAANTAFDFHFYKKGTCARRIERRMGLAHIEDSAAYVGYLKSTPAELQNLAQDLLISVTAFFRDTEAFAYLSQKTLPDLIARHNPGVPFRVWVPACASGEEAYSIAMILIEGAAAANKKLQFQIFASDIDQRALDVARAGIYSETIEVDVSKTRLKRFFIKEDHSYRVNSELRDMVIFAVHNILRDAPFSKIDLISCRNLMIYIEAEMQEKIISMFHFALHNAGILFLGTSETVGEKADLFEPLSKKFRIYRRVLFPRKADFSLPLNKRDGAQKTAPRLSWPAVPRRVNLADLTTRVLLDNYGPAAVLINSKYEALYYSGPIDRYLKLASGEATQNILAMARDNLRPQLRGFLPEAIASGDQPLVAFAHIKRAGKMVVVKIMAHRVSVGGEELAVVTFVDEAVTEKAATSVVIDQKPQDGNLVHSLEEELETMRRDLNATIKELEVTNEDMKAANEEAMSMNEEFQSTNEELETSKEELQSLNEELITVNSQLQEKVEEQRKTNNDLANLISSLDIAAVFLDRDLKIRRFTPAATELFNIIITDVGRPLTDITWRVDDSDVMADAKTVLARLIPAEKHVRGPKGEWFIRRMLPYRNENDRIDGVVITFINITEMKRAEEKVEQATRLAENIVNTIREPVVVLDQELRVISANHAFYHVFDMLSSATEGRLFLELGNGQWNVPSLRKVLSNIIKKDEIVEGFEIEADFSGAGHRIMRLNGRKLPNWSTKGELILLAIEDVTSPVMRDHRLLRSEMLQRSILDTMPDVLIMIDQKGIIHSISKSATQVLGYDPGQAIGQNVKMLMTPSDHEKHDSYLVDHLKTGDKRLIGRKREVECLRKDGTTFLAELAINEIKFEGNHFYVGFLSDLTERHKMEQQLLQAQKMEAIGQLTGGIAHDFNNLLAVVLGNLELMEPLAREDNAQRKLIGKAKAAVERGSQLTARLLAFGRRHPLKPNLIDVKVLIENFMDILRRTLGANIDVIVTLDEHLWSTRADEGQLENVLLNLAINARDAMPAGGKLTIKVANVTLDEKYRKKNLEAAVGDYIELSITDTGCGMSPDVVKHAFEPFFTTKGSGMGSGLGLSMVYGFVKQSKGHIRTDSKVGKGTTITLYLPALLDQSVTSRKRVAKTLKLPMSLGETIMVVEDDPFVRETSVSLLSSLGYKVIEAGSGVVARDLLLTGVRPDLMFTDVLMPGSMSGIDLGREAVKKNPNLKILYTSGYTEQKDGENRGIEPTPLLRKPYSEADLARKIREVLGD